jgi:hypothetical protein
MGKYTLGLLKYSVGDLMGKYTLGLLKYSVGDLRSIVMGNCWRL